MNALSLSEQLINFIVRHCFFSPITLHMTSTKFDVKVSSKSSRQTIAKRENNPFDEQ
jgi:hypothetical protein